MTAQIQYFCSPQEECAIIDHLVKDPVASVFFLDGYSITEMPEFSSKELPTWPEFVCLYLWAKEFGPLQWHTSRPKAVGTTHRSLVARLFSREDWDQSGLDAGDALLDQDTSPGICYKRAEKIGDQIGPCTLIAPPSSLDWVGSQYARWVNRCISWIRRRGKKVHDWKNRSQTIPNPHGLLNTIYAFPEALKQLDSEDHPFVIR